MVDQHPQALDQVIGQIAWQPFTPTRGVARGLYWIGPIALLALVGAEVKEDFQGGDTLLEGGGFPALGQSMVDKGLDVGESLRTRAWDRTAGIGADHSHNGWELNARAIDDEGGVQTSGEQSRYP